MRVAIVLSDVSFPPVEGLHQQSLSLVRELHERGVEVEVFTFGRSLDSSPDALAAHLSVPVHVPARRLKGSTLMNSMRAMVPWSRASRAVRRVSRALEAGKFDVVHVEGALAVRVQAPRSARRILSWVDLGSARYKRLSSGVSGLQRARFAASSWLYQRVERAASRDWGTWHVVRHADAQVISEAQPGVVPIVIPPMIPGALVPKKQVVRSSRRILVFADLRQHYLRASFEYFVEHVLRRRAEDLGYEVRVLGRIPVDADLLQISEGLDIEYIEWVEDYVAELCSAAVVVLPDLDGSGIKNRTLQALSLGCTVLGGSAAFEGIPVRDGCEAMVYEDGVSASERLERLMRDDASRERIGRAAREFAYANYSARSVTDRWIATYSGGEPR